MGITAEQKGEGWISGAFGVPLVPESRRDHYPFSRGAALLYRLKLAAVLMNAACALFRTDDPCDRLSILLTCWLIGVTCEGVYRNYPWREPLNVWMWKLRWTVPCSGVLSAACALLILLLCTRLGAGCELAHPLVAASVLWLCCMVSWPLFRGREERSEYDYDYFSADRPHLLTLPGPLGLVAAALLSPSLVALLAATVAASVATTFLSGWIADFWTASTGLLALGGLALLCCHRLPEDVGRTLAAWDVDEESHVRRIENSLRIVKGNLRTSGMPREGSSRFDQLAVQVPLLQREAGILLTASRTLSEGRAEELGKLTTAPELVQFRGMLDQYGPYTTQCSVS